MESDWAAEHLQVIRTLMERSAIYRRALAPMMLMTGVVGLLAAVGGRVWKIDSARGFVLYWLLVSLIPLAGSYLLVRRQALHDAEPFWSPPTRRITQALAPALSAGLMLGLFLLGNAARAATLFSDVIVMTWLPLGWVVLYGCALHAAGFFMPRGMKLFGWIFILGGCLLLTIGAPEWPRPLYAHGVMGFFFGALHLSYGVYLYFTEREREEA